MEGENLDGAMKDAFEGFLNDRIAEGIGRSSLEKWDAKERKFIGALDIEGVLVKAGLDKETAYEIASTILIADGDAQDKTYSQGVKDGFQLALHLLGMAPRNGGKQIEG